MDKIYKANPIRVSKDIFKLYHFCSITQQEVNKNTGLIIEDGLFEFCFLKEKDIQLSTQEGILALPPCFLIGKVGIPYRFEIPEKMTYFTIKLQPWVSSFFVKNTVNSINDLSQNLYPDISKLHYKIFNTNDFNEQIHHVEDFFLKQDLPDINDFKISKEVCNYIYQKQGNIKSKDLIALFPYSRQKLNRLFLEQTKNSIKEFSVYTRLRAIMSYKMNHPEESLTNITYKFGYFDQSHFIKDMKKVTGIAPLEFSNTNNFFFEQIKNKP